MFRGNLPHHGDRDPRLRQCFGAPTSLHPEQNRDPFTHFASRSGVTDSLTDAPRYGIIGRNSPHIMHSFDVKIKALSLEIVTTFKRVKRMVHSSLADEERSG